MTYYSRSVNSFNPSDKETNFILGRRAFKNNIDNRNISGKPDTYKQLSNKCSNNNCTKGMPLKDNSSSTRIQRLRLTTIGSASMVVNNQQNNELIQTNKNVKNDNNDVNRALSRSRSSGYVAPRKSNTTKCS